MQAVSAPALGERTVSVQRIRAEAVCSFCEASSHAFRIVILEGGGIQARCFACGEVWETEDREPGQDAGGDQAMAQGGDESGDVVPSPEGEVAYSKVASGIRGGYQAPEGGEKPKAPTTGSGVSDREAYNAFMREYMRQWREKRRRSRP